MPDSDRKEAAAEVQRVRLTVQLTIKAYDALTEIQRQYRRHTGRSLPIWKIMDSAIIAYAKRQEIRVGE